MKVSVNRRVKTVPYRSTWGNVKMRGMKACAMSCGCCTIFNEKQDQLLAIEAKEALKDLDDAAAYDFFQNLYGFTRR